MEIQNTSTTSSKSNQLQNVNTVRWEFVNVTSQLSVWEIKNRKSEVIAFVVNAGMNVTANNFNKKDKTFWNGMTGVMYNFREFFFHSSCT